MECWVSITSYGGPQNMTYMRVRFEYTNGQRMETCIQKITKKNSKYNKEENEDRKTKYTVLVAFYG